MSTELNSVVISPKINYDVFAKYQISSIDVNRAVYEMDWDSAKDIPQSDKFKVLYETWTSSFTLLDSISSETKRKIIEFIIQSKINFNKVYYMDRESDLCPAENFSVGIVYIRLLCNSDDLNKLKLKDYESCQKVKGLFNV